MRYVSRRIEVTKRDGNTEIISDSDFSNLDAPLVLLGEPGAGKTETARAISLARHGSYVTAYSVASGTQTPVLSQRNPVIDGLDEVQASSSEQPLIEILRRLEDLEVRSFVLTCRATDWANVQNERAVENWFGKKPVVGHLQPLTDAEVAEMVDAFGTYSAGGEEFVRQAESRNAIDLARNPQSLKLLLAAIAESGWPATKTKLYALACENFANEPNDFHKSLNPERPPSKTLLSAAGFVCAQLLLSGKRGLNIDGQDDNLFPRAVEFASETVPICEVESAIASLLFRSSGADCVEPTHRTVAEYLGAKWLAAAGRNGRMSIRRLEVLLYSENTVPGPLRGLHAWLATLDRGLTDRLVSRDPYGCFRYGDVEQYSADQTRHLIVQLQNLATMDPHFRSEDWGAQVGSGLAKPELRGEILELIKNANIPYQLSTVVLESIRGSGFASTIRDDLRRVVLDEDMTYVTRDRALDALVFNNDEEDWAGLAIRLSASGSHNSARMAVEIVIDHIGSLDGKDLGEILVAYDRANEERSVGLSLGIDYRLFPRMKVEQLRRAIPVLAAELPSGRYNRSNLERRIEERLHSAVEALLEAGGEVRAEELWSWLRNVTRYQYRTKDWNTFSLEYFSQRHELRREVQALALENLPEDERRLVNFHLSEMATGLMLRESDFAFHLDALLERELDPNDLAVRWRDLVQLVLANRDFTGVAERVARQQAETRPELKAIIAEIEHRPRPEWETEQEEWQRGHNAKERQRTVSRHINYTEIQEEIQSGNNFGALDEIAAAYLGLFGEVRDFDDPVSRVEWLVGSENVKAALRGLSAACHRKDLPTPRDIAKLHAEESQRYFLERTVVAGCALELALGRDLNELPRETLLCALTGCQWGWYSQDRFAASGLEKTLTQTLFASVQEMEPFIRDTLEPALFSGSANVSGLSEVAGQERFADLISKLSLEWLRKSELISDQSLRYLLTAALERSDRADLCDLIAEKLADSDWPSDEHRRLWISAAFAANFDKFVSEVRNFSVEGPETLSALTSLPFPERRPSMEALSIPRLAFLIDTYAHSYQLVEPPTSGWGNDSPYESARFIAGCIHPSWRTANRRIAAGTQAHCQRGPTRQSWRTCTARIGGAHPCYGRSGLGKSYTRRCSTYLAF